MRKNMIWVIIYKTDENSNCRQNKGQDNFFFILQSLKYALKRSALDCL